MTGSLREKYSKYYMRISFKNEKGEWRQKQIATGLDVRGNKKKAQKMLDEYLTKNSDKGFQEEQGVLLVDYLKEWFEYGNKNVDQITKEGYYGYIFKHIIPYFEPLKLNINQLRAKHVVDFYSFKSTGGRLDGKPGGVSSSTLRKFSFMLNKALTQAKIEELILTNPAEKIPIPKKECDKKVRNFLNIEQATVVLNAFEGHILKPLVAITLYYGLRRSEAIGLKWDAVDFVNGTLEIKHTVVKNLTIVAKDKTKNKASRRKYKLLPEVRKMLEDLRVKQNENELIFGKEYEDNGYIFTWQDGRLLRPDYVTHSFQKVLKQNGLQKLRFHDLRHSCASILYDKKWQEKDIQEWMGHADIQTTMNIYTHISESRKEIMTKDLEGLFKI